MKAIPSFRPSITYKQLNKILFKLLFHNAPDQVIASFEQGFAQYLGVKYAIRVPSARWGLYYILKSLNLNEGDEVILPAFSYFAVPAVILKLGLIPVFVDTNSDNLNINIKEIRANITQRTKAIIPTHLCGFVCGLDEIIDISRRHKITVIEDCAQSLGAEYKGKKVGSWGDFSYFSFGITKHFTTLGAGMIVTSDDNMANIIQNSIKDIYSVNKKELFLELLKGYIMKIATSSNLFPVAHCVMRMFSSVDVDIIDYIFHEKEALLDNQPKGSQLCNIQAELGIEQLNVLEIENDLRIKNGMELYMRLSDISNIRIPMLENNVKNIFSSCPVFVKNKKKVKKILLTKGIDSSAGYMKDCSRLEMFSEFMKHCPNASRAEKEILYLPFYTGLDSRKLGYIEAVMREICH